MTKSVVNDVMIAELWGIYLIKFADHFRIGHRLYMKQHTIRKQNDPDGTAVDSFQRENGEDPHIKIESPLRYVILYISSDSQTQGETLSTHRVSQTDIDKAGTKR